MFKCTQAVVVLGLVLSGGALLSAPAFVQSAPIETDNSVLAPLSIEDDSATTDETTKGTGDPKTDEAKKEDSKTDDTKKNDIKKDETKKDDSEKDDASPGNTADAGDNDIDTGKDTDTTTTDDENITNKDEDATSKGDGTTSTYTDTTTKPSDTTGGSDPAFSFAPMVAATDEEDDTDTCDQVIVRPAGFQHANATITEVVEDCSDPFKVTGSNYPYTFKVNGETVTDGAVVTIPTASTTDYFVAFERFIPVLTHALYQHTDHGFIGMPGTNFADEEALGTDEPIGPILLLGFADDFEPAPPTPKTPLTPGTYTLVSERGELLLNSAPPSWWERTKQFFLPTAWAQSFPSPPSSPEIHTLTFTITTVPPAPECEENCNSNVLILPGIQASRLYTDGALGTENQLWIPNRNKDAKRLAFTAEGESIEDVYTRDVLDSVSGLGTVYQDFMNSLDTLVADDLINAWEPYAYDWRYAVDTVAKEGTAYENEIKNAIDRIEVLAADSRTGKVTLVGHSNGGLLAKALATELEKQGKSELLDTIVLLASPQLGTPKAIGSILHGFDQEILDGFILSAETARTTMANLPGAYGLIPTTEYFTQTDRPVVRFNESSTTDIFTSVYGSDIDTYDEMKAFMTGTFDNRPAATTIYDASLANNVLLAEANDLHTNSLQPWRAASGTKVVEIVGVGLPTVDGFEYREYQRQDCVILNPFLCKTEIYYKPVPIFALDGDETVMLSSARGYKDNKDTYYLDLKKYREVGKYSHYNFSEAPAIQEVVAQIITSAAVDTNFISSTEPSDRTNYSVIASHSPARLTLRDAGGRTSGALVTSSGFQQETTDIPNSYVFTLASTTYIVVPTQGEYEVGITGTGVGGVTLEVDLLQAGEQNRTHSVWIPDISSSTVIQTQFTSGVLNAITVDYDDDGIIDTKLDPDTNEEIQTAPDEVVVEPTRRTSSSGTRIRPISQVAGTSTSAAVILDADTEYLAKLSGLLTRLEHLLSLYEKHF